jgi:hypothetical protein
MMQFTFFGMLWLASALLLLQLPDAMSSSTIDHHRQSNRRRHPHNRRPITRKQLNIINDVGNTNPIQIIANRNLRSANDPTIQALLQRARPYQPQKEQSHQQKQRKLDDIQFDGSYSLKFSQCLDVQTYNDELFDQDILEYSSSGKVVSVKSYVLFNICQTNVNCNYDADDVNMYMVDLQTYLGSAAQYRANIRNDYCEACDKYEDYCNPQQEEEAAAEEEEEEPEEEAAAEEEPAEEGEGEDANAEGEAEDGEPEGENAEDGDEAEQEENPDGEGEEGS